MTKKEKKLLWVFSSILAIAIVVQGIPYALKSYQAGIDSVDELKSKRARLKKLLLRKHYWQIEYAKTNEQQKQLKTQLFTGKSPELIAARVQGALKKLAQQSSIKVDSMSLPDKKYSESWLLVTQTMSFKASSDKLMNMLALIKQSKPKLVVKDVQVRSYRKTLNCTLKVVGFSRSEKIQEDKH